MTKINKWLNTRNSEAVNGWCLTISCVLCRLQVRSTLVGSFCGGKIVVGDLIRFSKTATLWVKRCSDGWEVKERRKCKVKSVHAGECFTERTQPTWWVLLLVWYLLLLLSLLLLLFLFILFYFYLLFVICFFLFFVFITVILIFNLIIAVTIVFVCMIVYITFITLLCNYVFLL